MLAIIVKAQQSTIGNQAGTERKWPVYLLRRPIRRMRGRHMGRWNLGDWGKVGRAEDSCWRVKEEQDLK